MDYFQYNERALYMIFKFVKNKGTSRRIGEMNRGEMNNIKGGLRMTEEVFLKKLEAELGLLKEEERKNIIRDFKEYFANGKAEGKKEEDIIESLGPIHELVDELLSAYSEEEFETNVEFSPTAITEYENVHIKADRANITIIPSSDDKPSIHVKDQDGKTKVTTHIVNNTLEIHVNREDGFRFFFIYINFNVRTVVHVTIQLPQKLYNQLLVQNDIGKIEMNVQQAKSIKVKTDVGTIHLKSLLANSLNIKSDNGRILIEHSNCTDVSASTNNGRIVVNHSSAEKIDLSTDNGRIELHNVKGEIKASTDNGRIDGYIPAVTKPIRWKTDNGSITLKTDEPLDDATLTLKSGFGRVEVYGEKGEKFQFGDGSVPIKLKSDTGRIMVTTASLQET
ncbi:DUF1700 domain-containing protein [Lysinibacillus halotolerans]|uniref:DUF1700 domain-containing protein n=2 Tax=Lysinibacillus halotolerans TaxID=1368476 RepID=A0A3M8HB84_9BACI|nr:DUF1700 domain-containing protein [Lysinibacillus halotolerans]